MDEDAYRRELLDLGFPPKVVEEAARARALGLFDIEPDPDAIKRTIADCVALVTAAPGRPRLRLKRSSRRSR